MKIRTILLAIALALTSLMALSAQHNIGVDQRSAGDHGWIKRILPSPASSAVMYYDTASDRAGWATLGSNLSLASGTLTVTGLAAAAHTHPVADISDSTATGRALATAASATAARSTIGAGTSSFSGAYADLSGAPAIPSYSTATSVTTGLMSSDDKLKLDRIQRTILTTGAGGTVTWVFPVAFGSTPTVQITAQDSGTSYINQKITAVSPTSVTIQVDRTAATVVALIGLTILSVQSPATTTVHLTAM